jgi:WD40 repeat protein
VRARFLSDRTFLGIGARGSFRWDLDEEGRPTGEGVRHDPGAVAAGDHLLVVMKGGIVRATHVATGRAEDVRLFDGDITWSAFDRERRRLALGSRAGEVAILDTSSLTQRRTARAHRGLILDLAFSPDGRTLATASADGTGLLLDPQSLRPRATLEGHVEAVQAVVFHPDGTRLATGGKDGTVRIWDAGTGELLLVLHGPRFPVWCLAWSPDGRCLASGEGHWEGADSCIRLWEESAGR